MNLPDKVLHYVKRHLCKLRRCLSFTPMGLHGLERSVSKTGATTGSPMKYLNRDVVLTRLYHQTVTTPANFKATIGAPYMRVDTLGNHAGYYVKTNNASIAVSHYAGEADAINSALNSGVYLE